MICVTETWQHSGVDCGCLLKLNYDQVKPEPFFRIKKLILEKNTFFLVL